MTKIPSPAPAADPPWAAPARSLPALILAILLSTGCASPSLDAGLDRFVPMTQERTGVALALPLPLPLPQPQASQASADDVIDALLEQPLEPDAAMRIALLNNPAWQPQSARLGVAQTVALTAPVRQAYFLALAAQQALLTLEQASEAAGLAAELAARMARAGNLSHLERSREQALHADTVVRLMRARHAHLVAREELTRLMGLRGPQEFSLPQRLPELPGAIFTSDAIEALALQDRTSAVADQTRPQVRQAYAAYQTAHQLARHYRDEVVPLRKEISEQLLLRYNGMLIGVLELLADARAQIEAVHDGILAQRDFWLAETALQVALYGRAAAPAGQGE